MPTSKAGLNSQSGNRLDKMNRITATGNLSLVFDNIIDGTSLTITAPSGTQDGEKCILTWEFGSAFTLAGAFQTSLGNDTSIIIAGTDKSALVTLVWDSAALKWSL